MNNNSTSAPPSSGQKLGMTPATNVPTAAASNPVGNASAPRVASAAPPMLFAMKGFLESARPAKGVVVVTNSEATVSAIAMAAVADGIVCDHAIAGQPVHHISKITFLHASGPRGPVPLKAFASSAVKAILDELQISHCTHLNPLVPEGVHILVEQLKPDECVFAQVESKDVTRETAFVALAELNAKAQELGALLVIFVFHTRKQNVGWLQEHCNLFVEVGGCEPGPGAQAAIVLTNTSLESWHPHGIGRVMVEALLGSDNAWTYRSEPFIAERATIRLAWYLRSKGAKIEQIAEIVRINKSNVSRGLDSLLIPPDNTVGLAPPKRWLPRWAARYKVDSLIPRDASNTGTVVGVAGDVTKVPVSRTVDGNGHVPKEAPMTNVAHASSPKGPS